MNKNNKEINEAIMLEGLSFDNFAILFKSIFGRKPEPSKATAIPKTIKQTKKDPATQEKVVTTAKIAPAKVNVVASKSSFLDDSNLEKMKFTEFHQKSKSLLSAADATRPIVIHLINQKIWTSIGMNYAWDTKAYGIATRNNDAVDPEVKGESYINPSQLFNSRSTFSRKGEKLSNKLSYAKFTDKRTFNEWSSKSGDSSLNPLSVRDTKRTLLGFYNDLEVREQDGFVFLFHTDSTESFAEPKEFNDNIKKKEDITLDDLKNIAQYYFSGAGKGKKSKTKVAARSGRDKRVRRGPTYAPIYNIRKAPRDRWIGGYQTNLKRFYTANEATKAIASNYETRKLTDTRYGYRTHFVTIKAAENIISQLDKFLKQKAAAKPAATPAPAAAAKAAPAKPATANERRIKQLSKLLETKLVGSELNLFNEQDTPASEAEKKKKLQALLKELNEIKTRLTDAYNENRRPKTNEAKEIQGKDLDRFNKILSMLSWNEKGEIDFNEVYKKMQPAVAAKGEPAKPSEEVVKRPSETSCFYAIDRTISGVTDMSPTKIWASVRESWDNWYKEALELLEDEAASRQFYYLSGPQSSYLGVVKSMDKNAALNINLFCVSRYMEKFLLNLEGNGIAAQNLAQSKKEPVQNYSNFVGQDGTFATSRANKLAIVIRKVLAAIPKLRRNQNQNAKVTGDKGLATTQQQAAAQDKAAVTAAKPSKAVAAAVAARGTPAPARNKPLDIDAIAKMFLERANKVATFKETIIQAGTPGTANTKQVNNLAKEVFGTDKPTTEQEAMVGAAITKARNKLIGAPVPAASATKTTQQESIKEKREKLLNEAIFKKLVK